MPIQEYAIIGGDPGRVVKYVMRDSDKIDAMAPAKRADIRPVTRVPLGSFDPLAEKRTGETTVIGVSAVTVTETKTALTTQEKAARVRQAARESVQQTPALNRELAQSIVTATNAILIDGGSLTARQQAARDRALPWLNHWVATEIEAIRAANAGGIYAPPTPPAEDLP